LYTEYNLNLFWSHDTKNDHDCDYVPSGRYYRYGVLEVNVHVDENDKIIRAYAYGEEANTLPTYWRKRGGKRRNKLFRDLSPAFIADNRWEIEDAISDVILAEMEVSAGVDSFRPMIAPGS
jgi:hypothetical protein